jgi:pimeloyl-ACP methyl ester carboxylesterase
VSSALETGAIETSRSCFRRYNLQAMGGRIFHLDEPNLPAPGHNNLWHEDRNSDQVIVFVHGVLSDSHGCWYRKPVDSRSGVYWPSLVRDDRRLRNFSIYLGGYYTSIHSNQYDVSDCAQELFNGLEYRAEQEGARSVLDHKTIVFVCHSMGGIVVRYMLTYRPKKFEDKCIGLALIASPSSGSPWADRLDLLLKYFKHEQGIELKWGNWRLKDLDDRFGTLLNEKQIPNLHGAEGCEHRFAFNKKWLPPMTPIVPRDSAFAYFGRVEMFPDTDHFTCVKPKDKDDFPHRFLLRLCDRVPTGNPAFTAPTQPLNAPTEPVATDIAPAPPPQPSPAPAVSTNNGLDCTCQSLHWDVRIDKEGDAYNEMTYRGIVLPPKRPYVFRLQPTEVQSGHTIPFELIWGDGRSTEGAALREGNVLSPTKVEMHLQFQNRPTSNNPAGFALRCWDWNVYSMNMEEYRQKPNWREDGLDYAEKYITDPWRRFAMIVQFPPEIVFAKRPYFEVYDADPIDPDGIRNDELTGAYEHCFFYSTVFREAILVIEQPPAGHSCRISWLLGESGASRASTLTPLQRQRQRAFASELLSMRRALESNDPVKGDAAKQVAEGVNSVLASVAERFQELLGGATLDPAVLEISLMVLDEEHLKMSLTDKREYPCLRIAAGTHLSDPDYRALSLFVGDGNAGRAWKRRVALVFDPKERNPKNRVYVPVSKTLSHRFLISVPLIGPESDAMIFGILNFGTFDEGQAEILRPLAGEKEIEKIGNYAQSYILQRLIELFKLQ